MEINRRRRDIYIKMNICSQKTKVQVSHFKKKLKRKLDYKFQYNQGTKYKTKI